ncbi:uncharacterized protein EV420DRAFT_514468 [Desarmillaria tabescens]|uniref:F-box domain-containing protein n=1 Tax=Armillaria tabescens TaxID=1929756 RepID=A0AA39N3W4_ARMTA|nr:uncharacterized protein EV420DRAFT_514468 [Desarmillaria tabescens]KAK0457246.1 hypothetical protein EV420DRAFT_514468 [Desarmillaria tabescens]
MPDGTPIRRLPPELLAEVFERTVPTSSSSWLTNIREVPWILGHVSSSWRKLALSLPSLWSSIYIDEYRKRTVPMLKLALARSGTAPLTLHLYLSFMGADQMMELYSILSNECYRWKSISITLESYSNEAAQQFFSLIVPADYPILESFSFIMDAPFSHLGVFPAGFFDRAPMLHDIHMFPSLTNDIPWSQITTFISSTITVEQQFVLLREAPQLQTLEVEDYRGTHVLSVENSYPLVHASLTTFRAPDISTFSSLTLPALTNLYINNIVDKNDADKFSAFVSRSGCPLESLRFPFAAFSLSLVDTFSSLPTLRELNTAFFDGDVTPLLSALSAPPLILPILEDLELNQAFGTLNLRMVVALASYRHEHTPLRYLTMESKKILPKRLQAQLPHLTALRELQGRDFVLNILESGKDVLNRR